MSMLKTLADNGQVIAIIIAITWIVIEVLKQIWQDMSENVKKLLAIGVGVVLSIGAYYLGFFTDITITELIVIIITQIIGAGVIYDKIIKPIKSIF